MSLTNEQKLDAYHLMALIRHFEERCAQLYAEGDIGGFLHLYIGQEAVAAGLKYGIAEDDNVITAYRDHGIALALGLPTDNVMAEMLGKSTGVSGGKGGSMHLANKERRFWGGHAVVGAHIPVAAGLALADDYRGDERATICLMGDGATNIGMFHEGMNLAAVWELPVVWIIENNEFGMGTAVERASAVSELTKKALGYDISSREVDGSDVEAVAAAIQESADYVRKPGNRPVLLEIQTYRYRGHSMGDAERYRTKEEVEQAQQERDPIKMWANKLIEAGIADEEAIARMDADAEQEVNEAVEFAKQSPDPAPEDLYKNVYA